VARKRLRPLVTALAVKAVVFLAVTAVGLPDFGVEGLALVYLAAEVVTALAVLPFGRRLYRELVASAGQPRPAGTEVPARPEGAS
jgi:hypothetical protein